MRSILAVALALLATAAFAQTNVRQSGSVTPGHVTSWTTSGVIQDGGSAAAGNLSSLGVTNTGPGICQRSATTGAYNLVCLNATATSGGISMTNIGGATGGFTITLNGATQGIATVTLPVTANDFTCFADTTGTLKDCGAPTYANPSASVGFSAVNGVAASGMRSDSAPALSSSIYNTASVASTLVERDANQNAFANRFISKATGVATSGGTTTLTAASARAQLFTGSSTQTVKMPDATSLTVGAEFVIFNQSTGNVTVQDGSAAAIGSALVSGASEILTLFDNSTVAGSWVARVWGPSTSQWGTANFALGSNGGSGGLITLNGATSGSGIVQVAAAAGSGIVFQLPSANGSSGQFLQTNGSGVTSWQTPNVTPPTYQSCASGLTCDGSSHTYTATAGTQYIEVHMCGGAGGGGAQATNGGNNGTDTSFGNATAWTAIHGSGGVGTGGAGGTGGTNGSNGTLIARIDGGAGSGGTNQISVGGASAMFGVHGISRASSTSTGGPSGSCGGGAGGGVVGTAFGAGGGGGEYVWFLVSSGFSGVPYTVGSKGTGGAAGTTAGSDGSAGNMIIKEYH